MSVQTDSRCPLKPTCCCSTYAQALFHSHGHFSIQLQHSKHQAVSCALLYEVILLYTATTIRRPVCTHVCISFLHAPTHALAFAPRLDDAISITRNEDDFVSQWVRSDDGHGHMDGMNSTWSSFPFWGTIAPDEWVIASEFLRRNKTVS